MRKPLVLCIMDGVGIAEKSNHNAVAMANMPFFNQLLQGYPHSKLDASGEAVGLPAGTMGNSEVGHITIGAGRVVNQFLRRFQLENWDNNAPLHDFINSVRDSDGIVHLAGLMSDGRVHSDINDMMTIARRVLDSGVRLCIPATICKKIHNDDKRCFGAVFVRWARVFWNFVGAVLHNGQE